MSGRDDQSRGISTGIVVGGLFALFFLYVGSFALILVDELFLRTMYIHAIMDRVSPTAYQTSGEYVRLFYFPLIWLGQVVGIIPH